MAVANCVALNTTNFDANQQIPQWEAHTRRHIVEVSCRSVNWGPLFASQKNGSIGMVRLADMQVSPHVIERGVSQVLGDPRDLVLVLMMIEGEGMIGQDGRWVTVSAGDIVALRTDCPFTLTYPRPIRQMVLSVSQEEFVGIYGRRISGLEYLSRTEIGGHAFRWMIRRFGDHLAEKADGCADDIFELGMGMLAQMFDRDPALRNNRLPAHFLAAQTWIADHISDFDLGAANIAQALGVSVRHLNRLFCGQKTTVVRTIKARRLQLAHHMLWDMARMPLGIGEIAFLCGFSDQSLFNRQFRSAFGMTPKEVRRQMQSRDRGSV